MIEFLLYLIFPAMLLWGVIRGRSGQKRRLAIEARLRSLCPGAHIYVTDHEFDYLVIDFEKEFLRIGSGRHLEAAQMTHTPLGDDDRCRFGEIAEVGIVIDGEILSRTRRGTTLPGSTVIGGLGGARHAPERIHEAALLIRLDDPARPERRLIFFRAQNRGRGAPKSGKVTRGALARMEEAEAHLGHAMRLAAKPDRSENPDPAGKGQGLGRNLARALRQLADLHGIGALTDAEFGTAKARLLSRGKSTPETTRGGGRSGGVARWPQAVGGGTAS